MSKNKRILYLHQYFKTPAASGGVRSYHIAKALVDRGYMVVMLTATNDIAQRESNVDGIEVHYLPVAYSQSMSFLRRIWAFVQFVRAALQTVKNLGEFSLVYASSTPVTVGFLALYLKRKYQWPFIFEVRDLWPEVPEALGLTPFWWPSGLVQAWVTKVYRSAARVVVLSEPNYAYLKQQLGESKLLYVPNFADVSLAQSIEKGVDKSKINIVYAGSLGLTNDPEGLVSLAQTMDTEFKGVFDFQVLGTGSKAAVIRDYASESSSLRYFGERSKNKTMAALAHADVILVHFLAHKALEQNSPNKFFDALAMGKCCAVTFQGPIKKLVEEAQCGLAYNVKDRTAFLKQVIALHKTGELHAMGKRAQRLALQQFEKSMLVNRLCDEIAKV